MNFSFKFPWKGSRFAEVMKDKSRDTKNDDNEMNSESPFEVDLKEALNAVKEDKTNVEFIRKLVDCYLTFGDIEEAENVISKFRKNSPDVNSNVINQADVRVNKLIDLKDKIVHSLKNDCVTECLLTIKEALKMAPVCQNINFYKAQCLVCLGKTEEIKEMTIDKKIIDALQVYYQGDIDACLELLLKMSDLRKDIKTLDKFKQKVSQLSAKCREASQYFYENNIPCAIETFKSAMDIDPTNKAMINNSTLIIEQFKESLHSDKKNNCKRTNRYERNNKGQLSSDQRSHVAGSSTYSYSSSNSEKSFNLKESTQRFSPDKITRVKNKSSANEKDRIDAEQKAQQAEIKSAKADREREKNHSNYERMYSEAIQLYSAAIALDPEKASYYNKRAECYIKLNNQNEAAFDFLKVLELNPFDKTAYPKAAEYLMIIGDIAEAEKVLMEFHNLAGQEALKVESAKFLKLKFLKASNSEIAKLYAQDNFIKCLELLNQVLEIAEASEKFQNRKVECLLMLGRLDEAEALINKLANNNARIENSWLGYSAFLKGVKMYRQGNFPNCIEKLKEFREVITGLEFEAKLLEKVKEIWESHERGKMHFDRTDYEGAKKYLISNLKLQHLNNEFKIMLLNELGSVNFKLNDFQTAKENYSESLRLHECNVNSLIRRAETHYKLEENVDAIFDLKEAFKLEPSENLEKCLQAAKQAKSSNTVDYMKILGVDGNPSEEKINMAYQARFNKYGSTLNHNATALEKEKIEFKKVELCYAKNNALLMLV